MSKKQKSFLRLGILLSCIVIVLLVGKQLGLDKYFHHKELRLLIDAAGWWGAILYVCLFAVGMFFQLPGMAFVAAGVFAYGKLWGGLLAFVGAIGACSMTYIIVNRVGGEVLTEIKWPILQKILEQLDKRPVLTVALVRLFTWLSPPMNYALSLSNISFRHYVIGTILGLIIPIAGAVMAFEWAIRTFLK
jgi:uncharacterized membrane protein YdjX (TVP38/TMEM64 family)